jgi:hypothetical protein
LINPSFIEEKTMAQTYTLELALFNFIPNIAFMIGAYFLVRITSKVCVTSCKWLTLIGSLLIVLAGLLKATWKLLYTLGWANIVWMSDIQFILMAPGYLMIFIAMILLAGDLRSRYESLPVLLMAGWKIPFLAIMTLASMGTNIVLIYLSLKYKSRLGAVSFLIGLIFLLSMGALARGEQTIARQWLEEWINAFGQTSFAMGAWLLHQAIGKLNTAYPNQPRFSTSL